MRPLQPAVFLDRDGILNEMVYDPVHGLMDSPRRPEQVKLVSGAARLIQLAREGGFRIIVVTNQPGLAKATLTEAELAAVHATLASLLQEQGAAWDELRFCPHHPSGQGPALYVRECDCRKPKPGMLRQAALESRIDLEASWMVGDGIVDVQAGAAAGCRTILVSKVKLHDIERFLELRCEPTAVVPDLDCAARIIRESVPGRSGGR